MNNKELKIKSISDEFVKWQIQIENLNSLNLYHNKIAVQVTSTNSKSKIQSTLDKFLENNMDNNFDELLIIILGNKQKSYSKFSISKKFEFDEEKHIIDFKGLLKFINSLPTEKIEKILHLLEQEHIPKISRKPNSNVGKVKKILALKKN